MQKSATGPVLKVVFDQLPCLYECWYCIMSEENCYPNKSISSSFLFLDTGILILFSITR